MGMQYLKADTAVKVVIGPVVAVGDGFTPITTLALNTADEAEMIKHDAAAVTDISGNTFAAITGADGFYNLTLTAAQLDTEGMLVIAINDDSLCLPMIARFMVVNANVFDSLFAAAATDYLQVDVLQGAAGPISDIESSLVVVKSQLVVVSSDADHIESDAAALELAVSDVESSLVIVKSDLVVITSDTTAVESELIVVHSETTVIQSDTTKIESDVIVVDAAVSDVESSLVIVKSDLVVIDNAVSDVESSLVIVKSDLVVITSDTTAVESELIVVHSDTTAIEAAGGALTAAQDSKLTKVTSDVVIVGSDVVIIVSDTTVIEAAISDVESSLVIVKSDLVVATSDLAVLEPAVSDVESSLVIVKSDLVVVDSAVSDVESSLVIAKSDIVLIYSDTTAIESDVAAHYSILVAAIGIGTSKISILVLENGQFLSTPTTLDVDVSERVPGSAADVKTTIAEASPSADGIFDVNLGFVPTSGTIYSVEGTVTAGGSSRNVAAYFVAL